MALINLKELLSNAKANKYAVGGFAITNLDFINSILEIAIEEKSPVILQLAEAHFKYLNLESVAPAIINAAKNVNIPVCVHLDHGESLKTIIRAIKSGFTSVMFDGSEHTLEKNIELTREVVKISHNVGVSVEGELGHVGGEVIGEAAPITHKPNKELFTNVKEAIRFCKETDIDALAISIGNVHGLYKDEPNLDFERLSDIRNAIDIPLVLHGGSGISDEDFKKAIKLGICKVNYYTEMSIAAVSKIREYLDKNLDVISYPDVVNKGLSELKRVVRDRIRAFGSSQICASEKTICLDCSKEGCNIKYSKLKMEDDEILYDDLVEKISKEIILSMKNQIK